MQFIKFPHIANTYEIEQDTDLLHNINQFEKDFNVTWCVTEKIDGANIQLHIERDHNPILGKRTAYLTGDENFYNIDANTDLIQEVIDGVFNWFMLDTWTDEITIYGEYFGKRVLNRIDYNRNYGFVFFAMHRVVNGTIQWASCKEFRDFMRELGLGDYLVPMLSADISFQEALSYPESGKSVFCASSNREGIVIEPWDWNLLVLNQNDWNRNFVFKHKSEEFLENHLIHAHTADPVALKEQTEQKAAFLEYCTESRAYGVFSKLGLPSSSRDLGKYISEYLEDAWTDFTTDHQQWKDLEGADKKRITNTGARVYLIIKSVLEKLTRGD